MVVPGRRLEPLQDGTTPLTKTIRFRGVTLRVAREHAPTFEAARDLLARRLEGEGREVLRRWIETLEENCDE